MGCGSSAASSSKWENTREEWTNKGPKGAKLDKAEVPGGGRRRRRRKLDDKDASELLDVTNGPVADARRRPKKKSQLKDEEGRRASVSSLRDGAVRSSENSEACDEFITIREWIVGIMVFEGLFDDIYRYGDLQGEYLAAGRQPPRWPEKKKKPTSTGSAKSDSDLGDERSKPSDLSLDELVEIDEMDRDRWIRRNSTPDGRRESHGGYNKHAQMLLVQEEEGKRFTIANVAKLPSLKRAGASFKKGDSNSSNQAEDGEWMYQLDKLEKEFQSREKKKSGGTKTSGTKRRTSVTRR
eukprot:Hpha_TRINITY_DN14299_c0_g1::TRINITY_DN14299_c0_g1_i1::g.22765::m.22765